MRMRALFVVVAVVSVILTSSSPCLAGDPADFRARLASLCIDDPGANLVVEVSTSSAFRAVKSIAARFGAAVEFSNEEAGILSIGGWGSSRDIVSELAALEGIVSISSERRARVMFAPNDPLISRQWALDTVNAKFQRLTGRLDQIKLLE